MRAAVLEPNCADRCAIPRSRIQYRQPSLQNSRLKTPALSIGEKQQEEQAMIRAPQLERRCRQDDACVARRGIVGTARQMPGRIKLDVLQRGTTVADLLREVLERAFPEDGAAS